VIARMMTTARDQLSKDDAVMIATVEDAVPALVTARTLFDRFQVMIRQRKAADLRSWLQDAASSLLASFASGLQADERAVAAALDEPWSNGQTEGHITKLKLVKRQTQLPHFAPCRWRKGAETLGFWRAVRKCGAK
jgi:transposase